MDKVDKKELGNYNYLFGMKLKNSTTSKIFLDMISQKKSELIFCHNSLIHKHYTHLIR